MTIKKNNGTEQRFDEGKVMLTLALRSRGLTANIDRVFETLQANIVSGTSTRDVEKMLIMSAASLAETNLDYDKLATRLFLQRIYKEVLGKSKTDEQRAESQRTHFKSILGSPQYDTGLQDFDLETLAAALDLSQDDRFNFIGITALYEKLLARNAEGRVIETPQIFFMRVAMGLHLNETDNTQAVLDLYNIYASHSGISSTPTLFYSGMRNAQLSSCGGGVIEDTTESIFTGVQDSFQLGKWSYGIGTSVSKLRAIGSPVKSTGINSSGIIPFLKIFDSVCNSVNRGGRKRGAMQFTLENWHYETEDFIKLRRNSGDENMRTHNLNTVLFISDEFMRRVEANERWMLVDPREAKEHGYDLTELFGKEFVRAYTALEALADEGKLRLFKFVPAKSLWKAHLLSLFETGHPWVTFKDAMNVRNPNQHAGRIYSTNLCTEIAQNSEASETRENHQYFNCFLASVNLAEIYDPLSQVIDFAKLSRVVKTLVRSMDNANDLNFYPTDAVWQGAQRYRSIGVGLMGFQDLLFRMRIPFDSDAARDLLDEIVEHYSFAAIEASADLAVERGPYLEFEGSLWSQGILPIDTLDLLAESRGSAVTVNRNKTLPWDTLREKVRKGMRNGYTMSPAPNASTAIYLGVYPCIEPQYASLYAKENMLGKFPIFNSYLIADLEELGIDVAEVLGKLKENGGNIRKAGVPFVLQQVYKSAFDIAPQVQVGHAAVMAKWIDQSHSRNLFIDTTSGKVLSDAYMEGWRAGVKTFYYLRSRAATDIEKSTI